MPHILIEQGNALLTPAERHDAMDVAGRIAADCGFIGVGDIKLRIVDCSDFLMLDGRRSFVHITVHMLAGRSLAQKEQLTLSMRDAFVARFRQIDSFSIACADLEPHSYKKHLRASD